ncbi:hypothetical protein [Devosia sp. DBB001]|nr:hypothetical protein [Devosia sp. DBB001]
MRNCRPRNARPFRHFRDRAHARLLLSTKSICKWICKSIQCDCTKSPSSLKSWDFTLALRLWRAFAVAPLRDWGLTPSHPFRMEQSCFPISCFSLAGWRPFWSPACWCSRWSGSNDPRHRAGRHPRHRSLHLSHCGAAAP